MTKQKKIIKRTLKQNHGREYGMKATIIDIISKNDDDDAQWKKDPV